MTPAQPALDAMMELTNQFDLIGRLRARDKSKHGYYGHPPYNRDGEEAARVLEAARELVPVLAAEVRAQRETIAGLTARVEAMTRALTAVVDGDVPRPVKEPWSGLDTPSKHDICPHDMPMWQDCPNCISDFARATLSGDAPNATDR
jgi:hypothetical protein